MVDCLNTTTNTTSFYRGDNSTSCIDIITFGNETKWPPILQSESDDLTEIAKIFFMYFTPVIFVTGIIGNGLSVAVFCSKSMRKLSASTYLAALAISDICTLVFYVFVEWLRRGDDYFWDASTFVFLQKDGFCQVLIYLSYVSRIMSAWIIVVFTIERFTGICYPLKSFKKGAMKIILGMLIVSAVLVLYKPFMMKEIRYNVMYGPVIKCGVTGSEEEFVSFVLDSIFAVLITLVPFLVITTLNLLIVRKLFLRNMRRSDDTQIRLEFTMILFAISFFFVAFNAPYFAIWSKHFLLISSKYGNPPVHRYSDIIYWRNILSIVRTIFFLNYCVNFFLYSITGAYFRRELLDLLTFRRHHRRNRNSYIRCSRFGSTGNHVTATTNSVCTTYVA